MSGFLKKLLGDRGEKAAVRFLRKQGYRILQRQFRNAVGEMDIIAKDGDWIVFVEVKTRQSDAAGEPVEAVTFAKQKQLTRTALSYLKRYNLLEHAARFDVLSIIWPDDAAKPEITHYRSAFEPVGSGQMFS
jgi:putative endonuclease